MLVISPITPDGVDSACLTLVGLAREQRMYVE